MTQLKLRQFLYRCRSTNHIQMIDDTIGKVSTLENKDPNRLVFADRRTNNVYERHFYLAYAAGKPVAIIYNMGKDLHLFTLIAYRNQGIMEKTLRWLADNVTPFLDDGEVWPTSVSTDQGNTPCINLFLKLSDKYELKLNGTGLCRL